MHLRRAEQTIRETGIRKLVLYLWRPEFARAISEIPHDLSLYHVDDEYSFSEEETPVDPEEARLLRSVDRVILHSPALMEKKGGYNPNSAYIPNGVDFDHFSRSRCTPHDLSQIPKPRLGYVGVIKKQLDLDLMLSIARARPDCSMVLVGPSGNLSGKESTFARLCEEPNVYYLGNRALADLPGYIQHMDVCMMCYATNGYTKFIYPLKMHEYLAAGRPVVASRLHALEHETNLIPIADDKDQWLAEIDRSLQLPADVATTRKRQDLARQHDWQLLTARVARHIASGLGSSYSEAIDNAPSEV
jgi:glycosyltransferase involved in cell wall biosynthesis